MYYREAMLVFEKSFPDCYIDSVSLKFIYNSYLFSFFLSFFLIVLLFFLGGGVVFCSFCLVAGFIIIITPTDFGPQFILFQ